MFPLIFEQLFTSQKWNFEIWITINQKLVLYLLEILKPCNYSLLNLKGIQLRKKVMERKRRMRLVLCCRATTLGIPRVTLFFCNSIIHKCIRFIFFVPWTLSVLYAALLALPSSASNYKNNQFLFSSLSVLHRHKKIHMPVSLEPMHRRYHRSAGVKTTGKHL